MIFIEGKSVPTLKKNGSWSSQYITQTLLKVWSPPSFHLLTMTVFLTLFTFRMSTNEKCNCQYCAIDRMLLYFNYGFLLFYIEVYTVFV